MTRAATTSSTAPMPSISVVIPVLGEAGVINGTLAHLRRAQGPGETRAVEIIVVDGSATGSTITAVGDPGVVRLTSPAGRGAQMNVGARAARAEALLFLHADTLLPDGWPDLVTRALASWPAGAFSLAIDSTDPYLGLVARVANLRSRLLGLAFGDQGLFIRRETFWAAGGFADIPLMEDVDLARRLAARGEPLRILPARVRTSARRWEAEGRLFSTLRNWTLLSLYALGASPERLARYYRFGGNGQKPAGRKPENQTPKDREPAP